MIQKASKKLSFKITRHNIVYIVAIAVIAAASGILAYQYTYNKSGASYVGGVGTGNGTSCIVASMTQSSDGVGANISPLRYVVSLTLKKDTPASCKPPKTWTTSVNGYGILDVSTNYTTFSGDSTKDVSKPGYVDVKILPGQTMSEGETRPFKITFTYGSDSVTLNGSYKFASCSYSKLNFTSSPVSQTVNISGLASPTQAPIKLAYTNTNPYDCAQREGSWVSTISNTFGLAVTSPFAFTVSRAVPNKTYDIGFVTIPPTTPNGSYPQKIVNIRANSGTTISKSSGLYVTGSSIPCLKVSLEPAANPVSADGKTYNYEIKYGPNPAANPKCMSATWNVAKTAPTGLNVNGMPTTQRIDSTSLEQSRPITVTASSCPTTSTSYTFGYTFSLNSRTDSVPAMTTLTTDFNCSTASPLPTISPTITPTYSPSPTYSPAPTYSPEPTLTPSPTFTTSPNP